MITARGKLMWAASAFAVGLLGSSSTLAQQAHVVAEEVREFEILVKGKSCGKSLIKITDTNDGLTLVTTEAAVAIDYIVYTYRYEFHGKEAWQGNRLVWVDDWALDAGKKLFTRARVDARGSIIDANGKTNRMAPVLDMTTNYWRAPQIGGKSKSRLCSLLNADQGTVQAAKVEYVGTEAVSVMDRKLDCTHFRLSGGVAVDLWLDDHGRIVWQKAIEEGYPMELRLKRLTNNIATARVPTPTQR
jgi:uncharacterized protein DUF6134